MLNSTISIVVALISFMFMAVFEVNRAQELAPSPAPTLPSNDGAAIDQGIAYLLLLVALAIIYLLAFFDLIDFASGSASIFDFVQKSHDFENIADAFKRDTRSFLKEIDVWGRCPNSDDYVVYICFGSRGTLSENQMSSLASALEISNLDFILCVKASDLCFLPSGGFVVIGWAPQLVILRHRAVGSFVNYRYANEKLLADELGVLEIKAPRTFTHTCFTPIKTANFVYLSNKNSEFWNVSHSVELARSLDESLCCDRPEQVKVKKLSQIAIKAVKEGTSMRDLDMFIHQLSELKDH
ncbi:hypothetical protein LXL04_030559 [Taraxacum kok-saghyz]